MKIGIIGASGFIGLRACEQLSEEGFTVRPIVRSYASLAVLARRIYPEGWRVSSFVHSEELAAALIGCDVCLHAAIGDAKQIPIMADAVYRACTQASVPRLVWLSSASVHGQNPPMGTTEESPLHDRHPLIYNNAKVRAEWCLERLTRNGRVSVIHLRPGVVYGPRSRWIADTASRLVSGRAPWLEHGRGICNAIYVDNLVAAIRSAGNAPLSVRGAFLVGDAETVLWRDFLLPIASFLGLGEDAFCEVPPPSFPPEKHSLFAAVATSQGYGRITRLIPPMAKRTAKAIVQSIRPPNQPKSAYALNEHIPIAMTHEESLLQQCRWRLPNDRARGDLRYTPPFSFADGMTTSLTWLNHLMR